MDSAIGGLSLVVVLAIAVVVAVLVVLVGREIACWYFKINESLEVQKNLNQNVWALLKLLEKQGKEPPR